MYYTYNNVNAKTTQEIVKMAAVDIIKHKPLPDLVKDEDGKVVYDKDQLKNVALDYIFNHIL